ncbi:hypothetical protein NQD34_013857 [Periophthalmus magnuspinnatus]|nr:hypothetical protein NQD34_013857 [Periophthalmus magnuspinnatus]
MEKKPKMKEDGELINLVTHTTILALFFFLVALLILLFFLYKYLNREANGKYTVQRIVFREGGLRDRARDATVAVATRLGVPLGHQRGPDSSEEDEAYGDEEEGRVNSNGTNGRDEDEDEAEQVDKQKSDSEGELNDVKGKSEDNSAESSDEEQQPLVEPAPEPKAEAGKVEEPAAGEEEEDKLVMSGPIVINLNQFSGSVQWSEEDGDKGVVGDVTPL